MISLRTLTISTMLVFMLFQSIVFGVSDILSLILIMVSTAIIFNSTLKLQVGNKKALRANAKKNSFLYNLLSNEKSLITKVVSLVVSLVFSVLLILILKGIIINHGVWALFIIIGGVSFTIFSILNKEKIENDSVNNNLQHDVAEHANEFMYVVLVALSLNIVLSLLLSAHDTMSLLNSDINFSNFDQYSVNDSIEKNGSNYYTRIMINLYIVLDYFKLAVTTKIIDIMIPGMQDRVSWFYLFYVVVFILNMMKLFAFSLAFVLMQKSMETGMRKMQIFLNKKIQKYKEKNKNINNVKITEEANEESN